MSTIGVPKALFPVKDAVSWSLKRLAECGRQAIGYMPLCAVGVSRPMGGEDWRLPRSRGNAWPWNTLTLGPVSVLNGFTLSRATGRVHALATPWNCNGWGGLLQCDEKASLRSCGITSLKSLVGHTKAAAGVGAFIKAVMAANRRIIPPTAGCDQPNPVFDHQVRALYLVLQGQVLPSGEKIHAGVSAMGFGGINAHITLESGDWPAATLTPATEEGALLGVTSTHRIVCLRRRQPA